MNYAISELRKKYKAYGFKVVGISTKADGIHVKLMDKRNVDCVCPVCGKKVSYYAYSRPRTYKDLPSDNFENVFLHVQRKEMHCSDCGKHFTAPHSLVPGRYMTEDLVKMIKFFKTNPDITIDEIAEEFNVSAAYVRQL